MSSSDTVTLLCTFPMIIQYCEMCNSVMSSGLVFFSLWQLKAAYTVWLIISGNDCQIIMWRVSYTNENQIVLVLVLSVFTDYITRKANKMTSMKYKSIYLGKFLIKGNKSYFKLVEIWVIQVWVKQVEMTEMSNPNEMGLNLS